MGRLNANPLKSTLSGSEGWAATDPSSGNDVGLTAASLTTYAQSNMGLATGSSNGLVTGPNGDKLSALPTASTIASRFAQVGEVAIPIFVGSPGNGYVPLYTHVLDVPWVLSFAYASLTAGSTQLTLTKNQVAIGGFTQEWIGSGRRTLTASDTAPNLTLNQGDVLGISLGSTIGGAANMMISIRADETIT